MKVPFRVRLQMYPRLEQLVILLLLALVAGVLAIGPNDASGTVITAMLCAISMWTAVPEASRYRAFGVPLCDWVLDTAIAVHVVALACLGLWAVTGFHLWPLVGIVAADAGVLAWSYFRNRQLTAGDRRAVPFDKQSGSWSSPVLFTGFGPMPWRVVYAPMLTSAACVGLFVVVFVIFLSLFADEMSSSGLAGFVPAMAVGMANVLSISRCTWTALGLPARSWLAHAYGATVGGLSIYAVAIALMIGVGLVDGPIRGEAHLGQLMLIVALGFLVVSFHVFFATIQDTVVAMVLAVALSIPMFLALVIGNQMSSCLASLWAGIVALAATGLTVVTYRRVTAGNRLRPIGLVQGPDRNYYQLEGAAS